MFITVFQLLFSYLLLQSIYLSEEVLGENIWYKGPFDPLYLAPSWLKRLEATLCILSIPIETHYSLVNGAFSWETTHRIQGHTKLSYTGKCHIKHTHLFDVTVVTIIYAMNYLTSQLKSSKRMASLVFNP